MPTDAREIGGAAVFLDRDGVVSEEVHLLHSSSQLRLIPGSAEAIRALNERGLKVIVVTNQSVVARGLVTPRGMASIHRALRALLAEQGAKVDAIFYCPYHEDADLTRYRRASDHRKPAIGMFLKAARRFHLDLGRCFMIGDQTGDIEAGRRAGCRTILVRTGFAGRDGKFPVRPDFIRANLLEAAAAVCERSAS